MAGAQRLICSSADLAECGDGVRFEVDVEGKPEPAFAVRYRGRVRAYLNRCAHTMADSRRRRLRRDRTSFFDVWEPCMICIDHGARTRRTGRCVHLPGPRSIENARAVFQSSSMGM